MKKKKKKNLARVLLEHYPVDIFGDIDNIENMKQLQNLVLSGETGDTLFDFIVREIGRERNKTEILILLNRAISDLNSLMNGILREY